MTVDIFPHRSLVIKLEKTGINSYTAMSVNEYLKQSGFQMEIMRDMEVLTGQMMRTKVECP